MRFENTEVFNINNAIRGIRNSYDSWDKSDSHYTVAAYPGVEVFPLSIGKRANKFMDFCIGQNDMKLAQNLIKAGSEHRKFMRQIFVSVDITAPLYFWREFSTYKVGTTSNSCSTMHKLASTPITLDCFETDDYDEGACNASRYETNRVINMLESLRQNYLETKDKKYWKELIRWLPESWLQKRTITMSYENVLNMCRQRKNHKLTEWSEDFIAWVESLPYAREFFIEPFEK